MIRTDDLIRQLAADVTPLDPGSASRRLVVGVAVGTLVSLTVISLWLGPPFQAAGVAAALRKLIYPAALLIISITLLLRAGRPGHDVGRRWLWLLVPPCLVALGAAVELTASPPASWDEVLLGSTWQRCLVAITLLSLPVFAGLVWAFRRLAPTRLHLAGLIAGLTAGAAAASLYALYCPETTKAFLLSWYSLGIASAGLVGLLVGPRLLRW